MKTTLGMAMILTLIALPSAAQSVHVDYDRNADFDSYKTFAWGPTPETSIEGASPFMHSRIKNAIEYYLAKGGGVEDPTDPDLYVTYHVGTYEDVRFSTTTYGYSYGPGWGWDPYWGGPMGNTVTTATTYERGTLVIDIWDAETNEIVWRGSASAVVPDDPQKADKLINKALKKMVKQFQKQRAQQAKEK